MLERKETLPPTAWESAVLSLKFVFNPHVGRKDQDSINQHLRNIGTCLDDICREGRDPHDLIDVADGLLRNHQNGGTPSIRKQKLLGRIVVDVNNFCTQNRR